MTASLAGRLTSDLHAHLVFSRRVRVLAEHAAALVPADARSLLDVGCGDGTLARRVTALRPEVAVEGVEVLERPTTAIPVRLFDGRTLPFEDRSVDAVLVVDVLHHADDPGWLLREAARVARLGVVVKDHLVDPWLGHLRLRAMDWVGNAGHGVRLPYNYWSRQQWEQGFAAAGLREVARRERLGLYPVPARWLFERGLHFFSCLRHVDGGSDR